MKQVIAKYQIPSRDDFIQRLSDLSLDFGIMYWQHDRVYLPRSTTHTAKSTSPDRTLPLPPPLATPGQHSPTSTANQHSPLDTANQHSSSPSANHHSPLPSANQHSSQDTANSTPTSHLPRIHLRTEVRALDKPAHYELIFKRFIPDSGVTIIHRTPVENYAEVASILHQLGFTKHAEISRQRQDLKMGDNVVLHLDHIESLPTDYVKLETALEDGESVSEVLADLAKTLEVLGVGAAAPTPYFELVNANSRTVL